MVTDFEKFIMKMIIRRIGHDTENIQWLPVQQIAAWLKDAPDRFSWVDRAGLLFYLKRTGKVV